MNPLTFMESELATMKERGLYREPLRIEGPQGRTVTVDGRRLICFCANNYLDLAADARVTAAAARAAEEFGAGATASRLVNGTMQLHEELERRLAAFQRAEACLLFPTGYMANVGTIAAVVGRGDAVIADRLSHASLIDGCRLSGAKLLVYAHADPSSLERCLRRTGQAGRRLVVTDGVFSMDGDVAPLREILASAHRHEAWVLVDDAHGTGVLGEEGRGAAEWLGVEEQVDIGVGTLSKALGSLGGFVVGPRVLIDYLRHRARSFVYTTAAPPSVLAAALTALDLVEREPERRRRLLELSALARRELAAGVFDVPPGVTPIVPVIVGDASRAAALSAHLRRKGFLVPAIRPPTVATGTARLRVTLQCAHTEHDVRALAAACRNWSAT